MKKTHQNGKPGLQDNWKKVRDEMELKSYGKIEGKVQGLHLIWDHVLKGAYFIITNNHLNKIRPRMGQ